MYDKNNNLKKKKISKIGIAFGGGGARGFAHLGAIKAFEEYNLKFDYVAGTSVGSAVGLFYSMGMSYQQMYDIAKNVKLKDFKTSILPFFNKTDSMEKFIQSVFPEDNFDNLKTPLVTVSVDVKTGDEKHIDYGSVSKAIVASCCVPLIFNPVEIDDMLLYDGGLLNNIPSSVLREKGCDGIISIDVNPTRGSGAKSTKNVDLILSTIGIVMKSNADKGYFNSDIVIKPDLSKFRSSKTDGFEQMIQKGYEETIALMPQILQLFKMKKTKRRWFLRSGKKQKQK